MKMRFDVNPTTLAVRTSGRVAIYDPAAEWEFTGIDLDGKTLRCFACLPNVSGDDATTLTTPVTATGTSSGATFDVSTSTTPIENAMRAGVALDALVVLYDTGNTAWQVTSRVRIEHAPKPAGVAVEDIDCDYVTETDMNTAIAAAIDAHEAAHPPPTSRDTRNEAAGVAASTMTAHTDAHPIPTNRDARNEAAGTAAGLIESHDHSGTSNGPKLAQANTHESADTDTAPTSLHHTLGAGANQAMPGNATPTPASHAATHTNGTDDIQSATNAQKGMATAEQITVLESALQPGDNGDKSLMFSRSATAGTPGDMLTWGGGYAWEIGTEEVPHVLVATGEKNGKPRYIGELDDDLEVYWTGAKWALHHEGGGSHYYESSDDTVTPDLATWVALDPESNDPVPTIIMAASAKSATLSPSGLIAPEVETTAGDTLSTALQPGDVVNNLTTTDDDAPLSATQGKALQDGKIPYGGATAAIDLTGAASVSGPAATADAHLLRRQDGDARYGLKTPTVTPKTDAYTLALADAGTIITVTHEDAKVISVPLNATVEFPTGTVVNIVRGGAGAVEVTAVDGVTLNGENEGSVSIADQYQGVTLLKIDTNTWIASGAY